VLVFLLLSFILFLFNWALRIFFVEPVAAQLLGKWSTRAKVQKFAQSSLEMFFYLTFSSFGAIIVPRQDWFWTPSLWFKEFHSGKMIYISDALKAYYVLYAARYGQGLVSLLVEHKRKDFREMALHHFVTVWLIGLSYTYGWTRVGAVVMVLLDPADVPLHIAKQFKYVGDVRGGARKKSCQAAADFFFMVFMFLFAIMRLGLYPYVVWTAHRESAPYWKQQIGGRTCIILLYVLLALQIYWFTLVLRVAIKVITCGSAEDVRSDDDEDDSSEHKKRK